MKHRMLLGCKNAVSLDFVSGFCSIMREHLREHFTTHYVDMLQSVLMVCVVY